LMTCSPNLLKNLGIKLSMELTKPKPLSEHRLFQAIIVQALEDALNPSGFKKKLIGRKMPTGGSLKIQKIFKMCVGLRKWIQK
jgi:hypothetical protein